MPKYGGGNLVDANTNIMASSGGIDTPNNDQFSFWSRDPANSLWFRRNYLPNAILPVDSTCH